MQSSPIHSVDYIEEFLDGYRGECEHCEVGGIFIVWWYGVLSIHKHADDTAAGCCLCSSMQSSLIDSVDYIEEFLPIYRGENEHC